MTWLDEIDSPPGVRPHTPNLWNPAMGRVELQRTAGRVIGSGFTAEGNNALWTPAAGNRFRMMGFSFYIPSDVTAAAGTTYLALRDGDTYIDTLGAFPSAVPNAIFETVNLPGNGYLSIAANNVLNVNLTKVLTAGVIRVRVWGCEE